MTTDDVSFRRARAADLAVLIALLADDGLGRGRESAGDVPDAAYRAAFEAIDRDPCHEIWLAVADHAVVGMLQLSFIPGLSRRGAWRAQIESVRVAGDRRGQGIGSQLMAQAIARARAGGCRLVQLTTDRQRPAARRFYERLGFVASHHGMKRALDP